MRGKEKQLVRFGVSTLLGMDYILLQEDGEYADGSFCLTVSDPDFNSVNGDLRYTFFWRRLNGAEVNK